MNRHNLFITFTLALVIGFASCSSDDDGVGDEDQPETMEEQYVIATTDSENSYLMTTDEISEGTISADAGQQIIGTPNWYFAKDMAAYSFIYRQGDPGTTQSFALNSEGQLESRNEIDLNVSMQTRGIKDDQIYIAFSSRNHEEPEATFYKIDAHTEAVDGPVVINTEELAANGEYAYLTDLVGYEDYILSGFRTIKAGKDGGEENDDLFASDFNNHTQVAVFNEDLEVQKVIKDEGRTGPVAGQLRASGETGVEPVEDGAIYVFSSGIDDKEVPSGILKINADEMEFDDDYFFDISEASGGYKLFRSFYVGNNNFVLQMFTEKETASGNPDDTRNKFAVVNVKEKSFDWVDDVPDGILSIGEPYMDKENNEAVFPIETSGHPALYIINAENHSMTKGLEVKSEGIEAIGKLSIQE